MDGSGGLISEQIDPTFGRPSKKWRCLTPPDYERQNPDAFVRAAAWLLPWSIHNYPGYRHGIEEILGRKWSWGTIRHWHRTKRTPLWAKERLLEYLEQRLKAGQAAIDDLRRDIEAMPDPKQRRNTGFTVVREDGRDRRGNWRK